MTPTEKLLSHLQNILPRRDWEQQRDAITRIVEDVYDQGFRWAEEIHAEKNEANQ